MNTSQLCLANLATYRRAEMLFWNRAVNLFSPLENPASWFEPVFRDLWMKKEGVEIALTCSQRGKAEQKELVFCEEDISIGREPGSTILLPSDLISKQHARIFFQAGRYYIVDTGSMQGTYLNGSRLSRSQPLKTGDEIVIFPYSIRVAIQTRWSTNETVHVAVEPVRPVSGRDFCTPGLIGFEILLQPAGQLAYLAVPEVFIDQLMDGILGPLGAPRATGPLGGAEIGVLECLVLELLVQMNRHTTVPDRFELGKFHPVLKSVGAEEGVCSGLVIDAGGLKGSFRFFIPASSLGDARVVESGSLQVPGTLAGLKWETAISVGSAGLQAADVGSLRAGDVVAFDQDPRLLVLGDIPSSWRMRLVDWQPFRLEVDKYDERGALLSSDNVSKEQEQISSEGAIPLAHLAQLPVTLHVVLGRKHFTLAELSELKRGTIIELDRGREDEVELLANGTSVGQGRLVEVEGKLGVMITSWEAQA